MYLRKLLLCLLFLLVFAAVSELSAEPPIEVIYFKPSDVETPNQEEIDSLRDVMVEVQSFFASEMDRYGFGLKTFNFNPDIQIIAGKLPAENYSDIDTVKNEFHEIDFEVQNKVDLVFLAGRKRILGGALGAELPICWTWPGQPQNVNDCNHLLVIPTGYKEFLLPITAHEIGHAFGLQHTHDMMASNRVNIMYASPTFYEGVKLELKDFALSREDATFLDEGDRLFIQNDQKKSGEKNTC